MSAHSTHIIPRPVYVGVFALLVLLTGVTVVVAYLDLGPLNSVLALGIAGLKSALVLAYFMHLRYSERLYSVVAVGGIFWLLLLLGLTLGDVLTRGQ